MCLILFALQSHPRYSLVLAANRDEFYERPTAAAGYWGTDPQLLAGKDLRSGGTWLAADADGRFAAVVNYRDPAIRIPDAPSRGGLVTGFLLGRHTPEEFQEHLQKEGSRYNGFTILFGDAERLFWHSNRGGIPAPVPPGFHGISNHLLDSPWPKVERGVRMLEEIVSHAVDPPLDELFSLLADRYVPHDSLLPDTGVGLETERLLAPLFVTGPGYGTRSSTLLLIERNGTVTFVERTCNGSPEPGPTVTFRFRVGT